jgi:hypothetical protein
LLKIITFVLIKGDSTSFYSIKNIFSNWRNSNFYLFDNLSIIETTILLDPFNYFDNLENIERINQNAKADKILDLAQILVAMVAVLSIKR